MSYQNDCPANQPCPVCHFTDCRVLVRQRCTRAGQFLPSVMLVVPLRYRCIAGSNVPRPDQRRLLPCRPAHNHWVVGEERDTYRRIRQRLLMDKEGKGLIEATLDAVRMRLRPIPDDVTGLYSGRNAAGHQLRRRFRCAERRWYWRNGWDGDGNRVGDLLCSGVLLWWYAAAFSCKMKILSIATQ